MSVFTSIGIIIKSDDVRLAATIATLTGYLEQRDITYHLDESLVHEGFDKAGLLARKQLVEICDLIIVIGGDGTFLHAARTVARHNVPLLGVNVGRLGFLVDISPDEIAQELDAILDGDFHEEHRALLCGQIFRNGEAVMSSLAFNDVVLHNRESVRMLEFETRINDQLVSRQRADGLVISTPTGSTAYALSSGGPILHPELDALTLVPICPHTLSNRPIVVKADSQISLTLCEGSPAGAQIAFDAQVNFALEADDIVRIYKHPTLLRLIHSSDYNYYHILRNKLRWSEQP